MIILRPAKAQIVYLFSRGPDPRASAVAWTADDGTTAWIADDTTTMWTVT